MRSRAQWRPSMSDALRGRWETEPGPGELAHVDVPEPLLVGSTVTVVLPGEPERAWLCVVEGEQLRLAGEGTTMVVRATLAGDP